MCLVFQKLKEREKMPEFDVLISSIILQFSHFTDWSTNKPYLISQNFYNAFKSNEFVKNYLINIFKLNQEEFNYLEFILNNKPFTTESKTQPKKKKKITQEESNISDFADILKLYVQCFIKKSNRIEMIENLSTQYKQNKDLNILHKLNNLINLETADIQLNNSFTTFLQQKNKLFNYKDVFDNFKFIFVNSIKEQNDITNTTFCNKFIIFTKFGFKSSFNYTVDPYRSNHHKIEDIKINSKTLFTQKCNSNEHGHFPVTLRFTFFKKTLNDLKLVLFLKDIFVKYNKQDIHNCLYNWSQTGLLKFAFNIKKQAKEEETKFLVFDPEVNSEKEEDVEKEIITEVNMEFSKFYKYLQFKF